MQVKLWNPSRTRAWVLLQWCFTTKRRHIKCMYLYHAMSLSTWANVAQKQLASSVDTAVEVFKRCIHLIYRLIVVNHHRRSAQVWHVLSRDFSVLPAHPHVHPQSEWAIPAFAFPAAPLFITLNKGVWLESSKTNVVDSLIQGLGSAYRGTKGRTYWRTGTIWAGCPSCCHQWLIWVPVEIEPRQHRWAEVRSFTWTDLFKKT